MIGKELKKVPNVRIIEGLSEVVKNIYRETEDIKLRQRIDTSVTLLKRTETANTWDVSISVSPITTKRVRVKFAPTDGGRPYSEMDFDYLAPSSLVAVGLDPDPSSAGYTDTVSWIVRVDNFDTDNTNSFSMKARVSSPDTGALSFEVF